MNKLPSIIHTSASQMNIEQLL